MISITTGIRSRYYEVYNKEIYFLYEINTSTIVSYLPSQNYERITIPESFETIGTSAFQGCSSIETIYFGDSIKSIGTSAFQDCLSLTTIDFGNSTETIGQSSFQNCLSLLTINFSNSTETIGKSAFEKCSSLETITFGNPIQTIGSSAFRDCSKLNEVFYYGYTEPDIDSTSFSGISKSSIVYVPKNYTGQSFGGLPVKKILLRTKVHYTFNRNQPIVRSYFYRWYTGD